MALTRRRAGDYVVHAMSGPMRLGPLARRVRRGALALLALILVASVDRAAATTLLDYITFDNIDYIRWTTEEPGRPLTRTDLGPEFAVVECSFGEDTRGCPYGVDASAAFLPSGTRVYAVRGYPTNFRLAAIWKDRVFLYQAWRNPRARLGADLYDIVGKVRAIDVQRGEPPQASATKPAPVSAPQDVAALVDMIATGTVRAPVVHTVAEPRYLVTLWLADGTTLGRVYFSETSELMGGVAVPREFAHILERYLGPRSD
ncbi:MAG TPA: hypothetical protein VIF11_04175 [Methylomirabilota bacterium]